MPKSSILEVSLFNLKKQFCTSLFAIFIALSFLNSNTFAQEEKETLNQRLDRLEKQNEEFRKLLEQKNGLLYPNPAEKELTKTTSLNNTLADILALPTLGVEAVPGADGKQDNAKIPNQFKWTWKDGLKAETENKDFTFHLMTSVQFDNGWYSVGDNIQTTMDTRLNDGSDLRRARVRAEGNIYKQFEYQFDFDVSGGSDFRTILADPQAPLFITEAWMAMNEIPIIGQIRVGHQKEFMTFSNSTSHRFQAFMERPLVFDAYEDGFQFSNGISMMNTYFDKHVNFWMGFFRTGTRTGAFGVGDGRYAFDQRVCYFPILDKENQKWFVLSAAGSIRTLPYTTQILPGGSTTLMPNTRFFTRPTIRAGGGFQVPRVISTPTLYSDDGESVLGLSAQSAIGPVTFGGEYVSTYLGESYLNTLPGYVTPSTGGVRAAQSIGNNTFDGFYVHLMCFLTPGDHRDVNPDNPGWTRIKPVRPFQLRRTDDGNISRGPGAWEVKFRYDNAGFNNPLFLQSFIPVAQSGGNYQVFTGGLNWYLNPNMKVMADYTYNLRSTGQSFGDGNFSAFGMRTQMDF